MDDGTYIVLAAATWLLLVAVRSVRIVTGEFSGFELARRAESGDKAAISLQAREEHLPSVRALKYIVETVLLAVVVALFVAAYGSVLGVVLAAAALLLLPLGARLKPLADSANRLYGRYEDAILGFTVRWRGMLKWLSPGMVSSQQQSVHSHQELLHLAQQSSHIFSRDELTMLAGVLEFEGKTVADIMTPRSMIDSIAIDETAGPLVLNQLHQSGHSRFPVIDHDIDHIVGMLYLRDMVPLKPGHKKVRDAMRPEVFYIRQDQTLEHALHAFLRTHHHLLVVVNEYRETVGLLSLEDVVEALLGRKIVDEFDAHEDLRAVAEANPRRNNLPKKREDV
jgi:CBS domain containing-hemolysin-like protein